MDKAYECYYCSASLTEVFYANYYCYEHDTSNRLCGEADCLANWMQDNTQEYEVEEK